MGSFAYGFVGQHGDDLFQGAGLGHFCFAFAKVHYLLLRGRGGKPLGQLAAVGVAGPAEVAKVVGHLTAEPMVLLFHGPPAIGERAEPVPQIAGVPGTVVIAGQLPVEVPGVAGRILGGTPIFCHALQDGGHHVVAGGAGHVGNVFGGGTRYGKMTVCYGKSCGCAALDFLFC